MVFFSLVFLFYYNRVEKRRNLFYNVPARRKFLKKDSTEAAAVTAVMEKLALSFLNKQVGVYKSIAQSLCRQDSKGAFAAGWHSY